MGEGKFKRIGKFIVKSLFTLMLVGVFGFPFLSGEFGMPSNPLSHRQVKPSEAFATKVAATQEQEDGQEQTDASEQIYTVDDLLANIKNFVQTPQGGVDWQIFGQTRQHDYDYTDAQGMQWSGVRPEFSQSLKELDGKKILLQGYMFPLGVEEKHATFLLGPFPVSCPFHYHVMPNLIIEVSATEPLDFSYDPINIEGTLELVPKDDEYNVFYRLKDAAFVALSKGLP